MGADPYKLATDILNAAEQATCPPLTLLHSGVWGLEHPKDRLFPDDPGPTAVVYADMYPGEGGKVFITPEDFDYMRLIWEGAPVIAAGLIEALAKLNDVALQLEDADLRRADNGEPYPLDVQVRMLRAEVRYLRRFVPSQDLNDVRTLLKRENP